MALRVNKFGLPLIGQLKDYSSTSYILGHFLIIPTRPLLRLILVQSRFLHTYTEAQPWVNYKESGSTVPDAENQHLALPISPIASKARLTEPLPYHAQNAFREGYRCPSYIHISRIRNHHCLQY